jgi:uncharacterized membrane protein YfcA
MPAAHVLYPVLFVTALLAGLVDAVAGGGGLITAPVLLAMGIPPQMMLGTNKLQSTFGSFTATRHYAKMGVVDIKDVIPGILATACGAAVGTWTVQQLNSEFLAKLIPVLLIVIAIHLLVSRRFGHVEKHPRMPHLLFYLVFGLGLGFYDGFFGPGVGSFWAMAFVLLLGMDLMKATGHTKVMNFTSNVVSLCVFILGGNVLYSIGLTMAVGQIIGSRLGAGLAVRRGVTFIRPVFLSVVLLLAGKLIYSSWF